MAPIIFRHFAARTLVGLEWAGSHEAASRGAVRALMHEVLERLGLPAGAPGFGVSWTDRPDGFRHFYGVEAAHLPALPPGMARLDLDTVDCLTLDHPGGDATQGYAALMAERDERGCGTIDDPAMIDEHRGGTVPPLRLWLPIGSVCA